jgi:hypothetical protein
MKFRRCCAAVAQVVLMGLSCNALAQTDISIYGEEHKRVRGSESIPAYGPDLFGDKIALYSGRLEFVQTDFSLPGNSALPMGVGRRFTTGGRDILFDGGMFGDWDLELPRVHGIFATGLGNYGWAIQGSAQDLYKRCSLYGSPPIGRGIAGGTPSFDPEEYWFGSAIYVPGQGDEEVLWREAANTSSPVTVAVIPW